MPNGFPPSREWQRKITHHVVMGSRHSRKTLPVIPAKAGIHKDAPWIGLLEVFWAVFYFGLEVCKVIRPISPKTCKFNTNNSTIFPYRSIYYCFIQGGLHIFRLIIFTMKEPVRAVMRNASHFCQPCACWWFRFADQEAHVLWKGTTSGSWSGGTSHFHSWKKTAFWGDYQILRGTVNA